MKLIKLSAVSTLPVYKFFAVVAALLLAGCGVDGDTQATSDGALQAREVDRSAVLFETDRVMEIAFKWTLRNTMYCALKVVSAADVFSGCDRDYDYTFFPATVTVDGEQVRDALFVKKVSLAACSYAPVTEYLIFRR